MTGLHGHNFKGNHRTRELHLSEKLSAAEATTHHAMKVAAEQAAHTLPVVQAATVSAVKATVTYAPHVAPFLDETTNEALEVVHQVAAPAIEAMSTPEGRKKAGIVALHVADHIIDEASRPYTGALPVYKYTKEAIVVASEKYSENRKKKVGEC